MNRFAQYPIVVPIDFSGEADRAMDCALETAISVDRIRAIHAARQNVVDDPAAYEIVGNAERRERLQAEFGKRYASSKYRGVRFDVRFGDPSQVITDFAKEIKAGLIILPSNGQTGLSRVLIGPVAERVVRLAPCAVLVLRASQSTELEG